MSKKMNLETAIIAFFFGIFGAFIGSLFGTWLVIRQKNIDRTLDMHKEFYSADLYQTRVRCSIMLAENESTTAIEFYDRDMEMGNRIWQLTAFYERLWLAIQHGQVDRKKVQFLFGKTFTYWYEVMYVPRFEKNNPELKKMASLYNWLFENTPQEETKYWTSEAFREKTRLDAQIKN